MTEFMHWLSRLGNAVLILPVVLAVLGICTLFDCIFEDEESRPEDKDYD
ncbi:hypothetical protein [Serratia fonticola]|nr:hypothetical protein [Serratia fonticola]CAI1687500.1 Uncharacterised protein [Serratia fonticola]